MLTLLVLLVKLSETPSILENQPNLNANDYRYPSNSTQLDSLTSSSEIERFFMDVQGNDIAKGLASLSVRRDFGFGWGKWVRVPLTALSILKLLPYPKPFHPTGDSFQSQDLLTLTEQSIRKGKGNGISMIFQEPMTSFNPCTPSSGKSRSHCCCNGV